MLSTSFVSSLLPIMFVSRLVQKLSGEQNADRTAELRISVWLNYIFGKMLATEVVMIKSGVTLRIGGSRLLAARKL